MIDALKSVLLSYRHVLADNIPSQIDFREDISKELGMGFFVKRDDILGKYGGNKVRKLEFLYPKIDRNHLFMFGPTGSHHLLANVIYGRDRFSFTTVMFPTYLYKAGHRYVVEITEFIKRHSAKVLFFPNALLAVAVAFVLSKIKRGFLVPPASTSPRSSLGFVLLALEIYDDVKNGVIPEPDFVFLPGGSGGTAAGLAIGLALIGLKTQIVAVQVAETCKEFFVKKFSDLVLREMLDIKAVDEKTIKGIKPNLKVLGGFIGKGYGYPTDDGLKASAFFEKFKIRSEPTYTAKTLSAILKLKEKLKGKNVLFYYTLNTLLIDECSAVGPTSP